MKMTEFIGYSGLSIMIDTDKIMSVNASKTEGVTTLTMQCGTGAEEWFVQMTVQQVLERIQP